MKLLLRIPLLLIMAWLAMEAFVAYACRFTEGYPVWPLVSLGIATWGYLRLRPRHRRPRPVNYDARQSFYATLFLLLAIVGSAAVLQARGEKAFEPAWWLHLAALTFFILLIPYLLGRPFLRAQTGVMAFSSFALLGLLWAGTDLGCCVLVDQIKLPTAAPRAEIVRPARILQTPRTFQTPTAQQAARRPSRAALPSARQMERHPEPRSAARL